MGWSHGLLPEDFIRIHLRTVDAGRWLKELLWKAKWTVSYPCDNGWACQFISLEANTALPKRIDGWQWPVSFLEGRPICLCNELIDKRWAAWCPAKMPTVSSSSRLSDYQSLLYLHHPPLFSIAPSLVLLYSFYFQYRSGTACKVYEHNPSHCIPSPSSRFSPSPYTLWCHTPPYFP